MLILHCLLTAIVIVAAPPAVSGDAYEDHVIVSYWKHVSEILQQEMQQMPQRPAANLRYPPPRRFLFESLEHLRAEDLLRAAQEGMRAARRSMKDQSLDEVNREVEARIAMVLDFYPVLAADDEDRIRLLNVMSQSNEDPILRAFLVRRCMPGLADLSPLSDYLQKRPTREIDEMMERLVTIGTDIAEQPAVQIVAIEASYQWLVREYTAALEKDPGVVKYANSAGVPITPAIMSRDDHPRLNSRTSIRIVQLARKAKEMAQGYAAQWSPDRMRSPEVKRTVYRFIERICAEIPFEDSAAICDLLDKAPEVARGAGRSQSYRRRLTQ